MEQLLQILFEIPEGMTLGLGPLAVAGIGAGINLIGGLFGAGKARRQARAMERKQREFQKQLQSLEKNRQAVIDPSSNVQDMSGMIQNPFANLQVATQAAEIKAEEADISLASTLDTIRATGGGSAGATALAQAALRSKQGIAADIEKQEARNAQLRAQGEQRMQQMRLQESARVQSAKMRGAQFKFGVQESRDMAQMDRLAGLADQYGAQAASSRQQSSSMFGQAIGSIGGALMSAGLSGALSGVGKPAQGITGLMTNPPASGFSSALDSSKYLTGITDVNVPSSSMFMNQNFSGNPFPN
tara:strand:+ start:1901 stop:2803 length:903 start_codon:yes stop_codon:yes gene_type:complete